MKNTRPTVRALLCAALLAAVGAASPGLPVARAELMTSGTASNSQAFGDIGNTTITSPDADIATATAFHFGQLLSTSMNTGRFAGMQHQDFATVSFTVADPLSLHFGNDTFGYFTSSSIEELSNVFGSRSFKIMGLYAAGSYGGPLQPNPSPAELTLSFNQNAGPGAPISSNATLAIVPVPEPGTIALVAAAAVTAFACRRRLRRSGVATSGPPRPGSRRGGTPSRCH